MDFDNPEVAQFNYRSGDILIPEVKFAEPVRVEAEHFVDCIRNSREPLTGLAHARTVVSILERARPLNGEVNVQILRYESSHDVPVGIVDVSSAQM